MARSLEQVLAALPVKRQAKIKTRSDELATLKDLRQAVERTQMDMAASLGVGQDTVSRIERRSDMLLSTLRRYIEAMGGELQLVARFPNRRPVAPLPQAAATLTDKVEILHIPAPHRLKDLADTVLLLRRGQQMDVIGHPDISVNDQAILVRRLNQRIAEELIIGLGGKDSLPVITTLDDVLRLAGDDVTGKTSHDASYAR